MTLRLRRISALAVELNKSEDSVITMLKNKSIPMLDGMYDSALFEAVISEPALKTKQRIEWGLSHRMGLGAVKYILDKFSVRITVHDAKGPQYLMLKKGPVLKYVKWHYAGSYGSVSREAHFHVMGFRKTENVQHVHYLFTCFADNFAWVMSRKELCVIWDKIKSGEEEPGFSILEKYADYQGGALLIRMCVDASRYELKAAKQLGF